MSERDLVKELKSEIAEITKDRDDALAKVKSKEKDAKKAAEAAKLRSKAARQVCAPQARRGMCAIGV